MGNSTTPRLSTMNLVVIGLWLLISLFTFVVAAWLTRTVTFVRRGLDESLALSFVQQSPSDELDTSGRPSLNLPIVVLKEPTRLYLVVNAETESVTLEGAVSGFSGCVSSPIVTLSRLLIGDANAFNGDFEPGLLLTPIPVKFSPAAGADNVMAELVIPEFLTARLRNAPGSEGPLVGVIRCEAQVPLFKKVTFTDRVLGFYNT